MNTKNQSQGMSQLEYAWKTRFNNKNKVNSHLINLSKSYYNRKINEDLAGIVDSETKENILQK